MRTKALSRRVSSEMSKRFDALEFIGRRFDGFHDNDRPIQFVDGQPRLDLLGDFRNIWSSVHEAEKDSRRGIVKCQIGDGSFARFNRKICQTMSTISSTYMHSMMPTGLISS